MIKNFINYLFSIKVHTFILLYLLLGTILFLISMSENNYYMIITNLFLQKTYLCIFVFPSFLILGLQLYQLLSKQNQLVSRFSSRKKYILIELVIFIISTLLLLIELFLIISSCTFLINHPNFKTDSLILFISQLLRLYSCLITLQLMVVTLILVFKKSSIAITLIILFIMISFVNIVNIPNSIINSLLLSKYIFYFPNEQSIISFLKISLIYYGIIIVIYLIIQYFKIRSHDFIKE